MILSYRFGLGLFLAYIDVKLPWWRLKSVASERESRKSASKQVPKPVPSLAHKPKVLPRWNKWNILGLFKKITTFLLLFHHVIRTTFHVIRI